MLVTDNAIKDAAPEITEEPQDTLSYKHWPTAAANIQRLSTDPPCVMANDLIVLD